MTFQSMDSKKITQLEHVQSKIGRDRNTTLSTGGAEINTNQKFLTWLSGFHLRFQPIKDEK